MQDKLINRLASLHITWWVLIGLIAWFVLGANAVENPSFSKGLSSMNEILVRTWLICRGGDHLLVLCWFLVLIVLSAILGVNLAACIYSRLMRSQNGRWPLKLWVFTAIHLLFALVMVLHGLEMFLGHKYPQQQLKSGQTAVLDSSWSITVHEVKFINDPELLKLKGQEARRAISRDRFDMQANFVKISLVSNNEPVQTGNIRMLAPMSHGGIHVILRGFEYGPKGLSARIRVVKSFLHTPFTIAYAMLIISMLIWFLLKIRHAPGELPA